MDKSSDDPICRFYRLIPGAPEPRRASRSAHGTLPSDALRYCEPVASASAFGWYLFPPLNFALSWDGTDIEWTYDGLDAWLPLRAAQAPDFAQTFKRLAPDGLGEFPPPFLSQGQQPGTVQIWSGYVARTARNWSLLSRAVANLQKTQPYENFEGILETDRWCGPLFTNVRLTKTDSPVAFHTRHPLFQVQPVMRDCYRPVPFAIREAADFTAEDWQDFAETILPNTDMSRALGHNAAASRKRWRAEETEQ